MISQWNADDEHLRPADECWSEMFVQIVGLKSALAHNYS